MECANREHAHHAAADAVPGGVERPLRGDSLGESNITSLLPVAKAQSGCAAATVWWISRRAESRRHRRPSRAPGSEESILREATIHSPHARGAIPESCQSNR